jgi:hypothetical protein
VIDALENRDVAVVDIPNAFIQTRISNADGMAIIRIRGELVDILVEIVPAVYKSYVGVNHKGQMKRDGTVKGRTVAGGNKQRSFITKEDASSPTVATSVLLTAVIDALEGREVAVVDIPNAFIQTRITNEDDMAILRIRGELVDILVENSPRSLQALCACQSQRGKNSYCSMPECHLWNHGGFNTIL